MVIRAEKSHDAREIFSAADRRARIAAAETLRDGTVRSASAMLDEWLATLMTRLPFTPDQFFEIFAIYNGRFSIVVAAWWLVTLAIVVVAWSNPARYSRLLTRLLAVLWAWNAVAYHALLFTRINPAAWIFAALFSVEAVVLGWAARRSHAYFGSHGTMSRLGLGLVAYSFVYPFLSTLGHAYPATPTFGVPCPTAILTIGLLLTVRGDVPAALAIVPATWAMIGGSAAWLLNVPTDYALLAAGLLLIANVVTCIKEVIWLPQH